MGLFLQSQAISFHHISTSDGLSHGTVLDICQDRNGMMWFATRDGLNSYDGYEISVYRHSDGDDGSLADNSVRGVMTDADGVLWVTSSWLSRYDEATGRFENHITPSHRHIQCISDFTSGKLLVACSDSLYCFDKISCRFDGSSIPARMKALDVRAICSIGDELLVGTSEGKLYRWNISTNVVRLVPLHSNESNIKDITYANGEVWVATEGNGLFKTNMEITDAEHFVAGMAGLQSNHIRAVCHDSSGRLWVGTNDGLFIYDGQSFVPYVNERLNPLSISDNSIRTIFMDTQGGMWVGTYNEAVNYWNPSQCEFSYISIPSAKGAGVYTANCLQRDSKGQLWIGMGWNGVMRFDPETGTSLHYPRNGDEENVCDVKSIYSDEEFDRVYFATQYGGLHVLNRKTGKISIKSGLPKDIFAIERKDADTLFLCTSSGLWLLDRKSGAVKEEKRYKGHRNIKAINKDTEGRLWIGGSYGVQIYSDDISYELLDMPVLEQISRISSFCESGCGDMFIATDYGMYCFDQGNGTLRLYNTENGLPNNVVRSIVEDGQGIIWIGTDNGLCRYNPLSETFKSYSHMDGLVCTRFSNASCMTESGDLLLGTREGLISFCPEKMLDNPYSPPARITSMSISGNKVFPKDGRIVMDWDDNALTLTLSTMNYLSYGRDRFAYRLKGYDERWHHTNSYKITYPKLPHGRYALEVVAANNDGTWNKEVTSLQIIVKPIWIQTIWAKLSIAVLILLIAALAVYMIIIKMRQKHTEELHQMKLNFFVNFLNELKTPLFLIMSPLQELLFRSESSWMKRQLRYIEKNSRRLTRLVDQMIDFRKAELGVIKLKVSRCDVNVYTEEIISCYDSYAQHRKVKLKYQSKVERNEVLIDRQYYDIILNNLISNAFKFTKEGFVAVRIYMKDEGLILEVKDTGVGLTKEMTEFLSGEDVPVYNHLGAGIGLSLVKLLVKQHHGTLNVVSEKGKGSSFMVSFPQKESMYRSFERIDESSYYPMHQAVDMSDDMINDFMDSVSSVSKKVRMLLFEKDSQMMSYLIEKFSAVFDVIATDDADMAVSLLKENDTDVVIIDSESDSDVGMRLCARVKQDLNTSHIPVLVISSDKEMRHQLKAFQMGADDFIEKPFSLPAISAKIYNILTTYQRSRMHSQSDFDLEQGHNVFNDLDEDFIRRAVEIVERNIANEDFSTADFAKEIGMSRSNLYIKLKALTGESALNFILGIRFKEACKLLKDGKYNISEISEKVGFSSPSYFSRAFKKYYGIMPSEYTKNNNNLISKE